MRARKPHPLHQAVVELCRLKPGATEDHLLGETIFRVGGRVFAFLGRPDRAAVTGRPPPDERNRFVGQPQVRPARYIGRFGWLTVVIGDGESLRLASALVDASFQFASAGPRRSSDV